MRSICTTALGFLLTGVLSALVPGLAGAEIVVTLPDPIQRAVLYGDFYSYSLPILASDYDLANGGGEGPGNPYYVASSPGSIKNEVVVATGSNNGPLNKNFAGMNDAYRTPDGNGGALFFGTDGVSHPGHEGTLPADPDTTWNSTIEALDTFLADDARYPAFFFNNNQDTELHIYTLTGKRVAFSTFNQAIQNKNM